MKTLLEIKNLSVGYKSPLFTPISLSIAPGQFISLMGENGAGKSTLIECLIGTLKPLTGKIEWNLENHTANTGWVISEKEIYPPLMKIKDVLAITQKIYSTYNAKLAKELLISFQLDQEKQLTTLSLGELSKLKLLKALAIEPKLLILDELTANLSPSSKKTVLETLIHLFEKNKMGVLYVCHSHEEALRLSDAVYYLTKEGLKENL